jgi:hypothetical protein
MDVGAFESELEVLFGWHQVINEMRCDHSFIPTHLFVLHVDLFVFICGSANAILD